MKHNRSLLILSCFSAIQALAFGRDDREGHQASSPDAHSPGHMTANISCTLRAVEGRRVGEPAGALDPRLFHAELPSFPLQNGTHVTDPLSSMSGLSLSDASVSGGDADVDSKLAPSKQSPRSHKRSQRVRFSLQPDAQTIGRNWSGLAAGFDRHPEPSGMLQETEGQPVGEDLGMMAFAGSFGFGPSHGVGEAAPVFSPSGGAENAGMRILPLQAYLPSPSTAALPPATLVLSDFSNFTSQSPSFGQTWINGSTPQFAQGSGSISIQPVGGGNPKDDGNFLVFPTGGADYSLFSVVQITAREDAGNQTATFNFYLEDKSGGIGVVPFSIASFGSSFSTISISLPSAGVDLKDIFAWGISTSSSAVSDFRVSFDNIALAVPEPSAGLLTALGIGVFAVRKRTRRPGRSFELDATMLDGVHR